MNTKLGITKTTMFLIIGIAGIFSMLLAPALNTAPADAAPPQQQCEKKGEFVGSSCPGNSGANSPTFDERVKNQGGNYPGGLQPHERQ